ncbi:MAG: hydrogenase 3 maturation endopeptidase HyCI [Candidatus Omnitrophica bacterium]|nr:hydrogenase 3 maturation endopeptidase HyCI [Candidatus Omnitrophota bacterium]MCF7878496.1 hydrogenase 3 maturation endopeptidase HyCI [Candidatus Omnitrophota bacterium]
MSSLSARVQQVLSPKAGKNIIVTVGNSLRADDGAGPYIGSKIKSRPDLIVFNAGYNPENIITNIVELDPVQVIFLDAANFGKKAGTVEVVDLKSIPEVTISTHTIPLSLVAKILEKDTKAAINFIGIQVKNVQLGDKLSPEVKESADKIIKQIKEEMYA